MKWPSAVIKQGIGQTIRLMLANRHLIAPAVIGVVLLLTSLRSVLNIFFSPVEPIRPALVQVKIDCDSPIDIYINMYVHNDGTASTSIQILPTRDTSYTTDLQSNIIREYESCKNLTIAAPGILKQAYVKSSEDNDAPNSKNSVEVKPTGKLDTAFQGLGAEYKYTSFKYPLYDSLRRFANQPAKIGENSPVPMLVIEADATRAISRRNRVQRTIELLVDAGLDESETDFDDSSKYSQWKGAATLNFSLDSRFEAKSTEYKTRFGGNSDSIVEYTKKVETGNADTPVEEFSYDDLSASRSVAGQDFLASVIFAAAIGAFVELIMRMTDRASPIEVGSAVRDRKRDDSGS